MVQVKDVFDLPPVWLLIAVGPDDADRRLGTVNCSMAVVKTSLNGALAKGTIDQAPHAPPPLETSAQIAAYIDARDAEWDRHLHALAAESPRIRSTFHDGMIAAGDLPHHPLA